MTKYEATDLTDSKYNCFESYWFYFLDFRYLYLATIELIWKLLFVWLGSVNLKNNEWLNMVDLCEFAEMIKYPIARWGK